MKFRILMATATAASVLMTAGAMAADNSTHISQFAAGGNTGATNSALVDQSGGTDNVAGSLLQKLTQTTTSGQTNNDGSFKNALTITQSGNGNEVGLGLVANKHGSAAAAGGVFQINDYGSLWGHSTNTLSISQTAGNNSVGAAFQILGSRVGANTATISQGGSGGHIVESLTQRQGQSTISDTVNSIAITQTGSGNRIARVEQYSGGVSGSTNTIVADIGGSGNGVSALTGFAAASGATSSSLLQGKYVFSVGHFIAKNSSIKLTITGNNNAFGVSQFGPGSSGGSNTVGELAISGDGNQLGTYQSGDGNVINLASIDGDLNNIGIQQIGNTNTAEVTVLESSNGLELIQSGNTNEAYVTINGSSNGGPQSFTSGGAAKTAAGSRPSGLVAQLGNDNLVNLNIDGDLNAFSLEQSGSSNEIEGLVTGNKNQVAVVQSGGNNYAFAQQQGANNNLGIIQ